MILFVLTAALMAAGSSQPPITFHLPPGKYEQAIEFHRRLNILHFASFAWDMLALALMLRLRFAAHVRDWAERRWRSRFLQGSAVIGAVFAAMWLWSLPESVYGHYVMLEYGLSINPWGSWLLDWLKAGVITGIPAALVVLAFFALARRTRAWWIYAWGLGGHGHDHRDISRSARL